VDEANRRPKSYGSFYERDWNWITSITKWDLVCREKVAL